ncbi:MAG TPA: hypothetical protein VMT27_01735 [Actinomycetes bacterium]|nr:hypothetical protein [Actinomycetes bacterium]
MFDTVRHGRGDEPSSSRSPVLHERIPRLAPPLDEAPQSRTGETPGIRPRWVTDQNGRHPALLLELRQTVSG